ncbi:protein of unknown function [Taphrina deformans PYCC 5710]|uniref:Uncharacterized protein n=1 Tax=Taphrina deformans (strain PYCC 5710 / ATCC 11124 / CBS 356.35 / IMI 108563 / JCM 9778 / NBRC 8474) TaxID=1097556 RepID=R4X6L9_TAPDE|nr:protein of unknown function [Taphrina deformans PYCC 5710]|eukprot:CCG80812.1 protein of unknown function [Taphrina deformans PYCC 5710]
MSSSSWAQIAANKGTNTDRTHTSKISARINLPASESKSGSETTGVDHKPKNVISPDDTYMTHRGSTDRSPLIVSLRLDEQILGKLTTIRKANFPPKQNNLEAHLTLLHALPATCRSAMHEFLSDLAHKQSRFDLRLGQLRVKPKIVLLPVRSKVLDQLVYDIQDAFWSELSDQDRQDFRGGHITLCNKLTEEEVAERAVGIEKAIGDISVSKSQAIGIDMWIYRGNKPWQPVSSYEFQT